MIEHPDMKAPHWACVRSKCRVCGCVINRIVSMDREQPEVLRCVICGARACWCWDLAPGPLYGWLLVDDWLYADPEERVMPEPG